MPLGTLGLADENSNSFGTPISQDPMVGGGASPLINPEGGTIDPAGIGAMSSPVRARPIIDGKSNPLQAFGAIMMNINRGMTGQPLYTTELRKQQQEDDLLELKRTEVGVGLLEQGQRLLKKTPSANRAAVGKQFGALYDHLVPGFSKIMEGMAANPEATNAQIQALGEHAQLAVATFGGVEEALQGIAEHPDIVKRWDEAVDKKNRAPIMRIFSGIADAASKSPEADAALAHARQNGWTAADFADPVVSEATGMTPDLIRTLDRDPELQRQLSEFGFIPSEDQKLRAQQEIRQKPLSRLQAEASIQANATANAKPTNYIDAQGNIKAGTFGERERMSALGYQPVVTGRTQQDVESNASSRVTGKQAGDRASLIDPYVARITGFDNTKTNQDFIDAGGTPDITKEAKGALQGAEKAMNTARELTGNIKVLVKDNPDANTRIASVEKVATNLMAEYNAVVSATGGKSVDFEAEAAKYEPIFKKNGIDSALVKQAVVNLAYMQAGAWGQTGHSAGQKDIQLAAEAVGGSNSDPQILTRLLEQSEINFDSAYRNQVQSMTGHKPPSSLPDVAEAEAMHDRISAGKKPTKELKYFVFE